MARVVVDVLADKQMFPRSYDSTPSSYQRDSFPQELFFLSRGKEHGSGIVPVLLCPSPTPSDVLVLYLGANGSDLGKVRPRLQIMAEGMRAHFVTMEYPGYGVSTDRGTACQSAVDRDVDAVYQFIVEQLTWAPQDVIVLGHSIGSGPAVRLAAKHDLGGCCLFSPYSSIKGMVRHRAGKLAAFFVRDMWNSKNVFRGQNRSPPLLIFHGIKDQMIPFSHSQKLYDLSTARNKRLVDLPGVQHNDIYKSVDVIVEHWNSFFAGKISSTCLRPLLPNNFSTSHLQG